MTDVTLTNHGSVVLAQANTDAVLGWFADNTDGLFWGRALVVEPRFILNLVEGLRSEGFTIDGAL